MQVAGFDPVSWVCALNSSAAYFSHGLTVPGQGGDLEIPDCI